MASRDLRWWHGWAPLVLLPLGVALLVPSTWPRWALMWMLAFTIYCGCKWLTWRRTPRLAPWWRQAAYLLAWPGLDAAAFLSVDAEASPPRRAWISGIVMSVLGLTTLFAAARWVPPQSLYWTGWVGMIGIALVLHFGLFRVLSCAWQTAGLDAYPLMVRPLASVSLAEFWGRRWNTAFRDLTHRFLFKPLAARVGPRWAILGGFMFSGAVHDLVISVPAGGGYGRPTAFFALQGIGMVVERTAIGRRMGLGSAWRGRAFTILVVAVPACLLFHPPFVERIVVPFMRALRAI